MFKEKYFKNPRPAFCSSPSLSLAECLSLWAWSSGRVWFQCGSQPSTLFLALALAIAPTFLPPEPPILALELALPSWQA